MTIRNLEKMFKPASIALIGASETPGTLGNVVTRNVLGAGFEGNIFPVNPKYNTVAGVMAYPDVPSLPAVPDLAVIITPPGTVPGIITQLGEKGTKAAVVISAGFSEGHSKNGRELQQAMLDSAKPHTLRIVGPNCLGVMAPGGFLNASFAHIHALPGRLAFVAQSGAVIASVLDWATHRRIGFSHFVSLGDMADVDFGDMLDYLANDSRTRAILLYIEAVTPRPEIHVGGTGGIPNEAGHRGQGRPPCRRRTRGHIPHRRPGRIRQGLRRRFPPGGDAAGQRHAGPFRCRRHPCRHPVGVW